MLCYGVYLITLSVYKLWIIIADWIHVLIESGLKQQTVSKRNESLVNNQPVINVCTIIEMWRTRRKKKKK